MKIYFKGCKSNTNISKRKIEIKCVLNYSAISYWLPNQKKVWNFFVSKVIFNHPF